MVAKDGRELDTDDEIEMHLVVCPRQCGCSRSVERKEKGRRMDQRDEKQIKTIRLEIDGLGRGGRAKCNQQRKRGSFVGVFKGQN